MTISSPMRTIPDLLKVMSREDLAAVMDEEKVYQRAMMDSFYRALRKRGEGGVTLFQGEAGSGKTVSIVHCAHNIRRITAEAFPGTPTSDGTRPPDASPYYVKGGCKVISIGTQIGLKKTFGEPKAELGWDGFWEQLKRMNALSETKEGSDPDLTRDGLRELCRKNGIVLFESVMLFDEGQNLFNNRMGMSREVQAAGKFAQVMRHIYGTALVAAPGGQMDLDRLVNQQLTWVARPTMRPNKNVSIYLYDAKHYDAFTNRPGLEPPVRITYNAEKYFLMYNSHNLQSVPRMLIPETESDRQERAEAKAKVAAERAERKANR